MQLSGQQGEGEQKETTLNFNDDYLESLQAPAVPSVAVCDFILKLSSFLRMLLSSWCFKHSRVRKNTQEGNSIQTVWQPELEYSQIKQFVNSWYSKSFSSFEFSDCINAFLAWKKKNFNIRLMSSSNTGNKWYVLRCLCCCWCTFIIHVGGKARWKAMLVCWTLIWTKISQQVLNSF